jgi:hypothetical protein
MNNNDIKNMLKAAANKQNIHDLDKEIINKVDTSKVVIAQKKPTRKLRVFGYSFTGIACASMAVAIGIGVGLSINKNNNNQAYTSNNDDIDEPLPYVSSGDTITYLESVEKQEFYNLVNIANSLETFKNYDVLQKTASKELSVGEEKAIANNINAYVYNIEDMLGILETECKTISNPDKSKYAYDNKLVVSVLKAEEVLQTYTAYYTETIINKKTIKGTNDIYKLDASTTGVIVVGEYEYKFVGTEKISNQKITFTTSIEIDESKSVTVQETFAEKGNEYKYSFYEADSLKKEVLIVESLDENKEVVEVETNFVWVNGNYDSKSNTENDDNKVEVDFILSGETLVGKFKSKNNNEVTVTESDLEFIYTYKNSTESYNLKK